MELPEQTMADIYHDAVDEHPDRTTRQEITPSHRVPDDTLERYDMMVSLGAVSDIIRSSVRGMNDAWYWTQQGQLGVAPILATEHHR
jgi:hypothetical protein